MVFGFQGLLANADARAAQMIMAGCRRDAALGVGLQLP
jgi:hypothetical protein